MLHIKKLIVPILVIALIVNFGMLLRVNFKLNEIESYQEMMYGKVLSSEANMNSWFSQIETQSKTFLVNGITVVDSYLLKEANKMKIKLEIDFSKMSASHAIGLEIASTKNRLDQNYDPYSAEYTDKEWIELKGSNTVFAGEVLLDLDRNYMLSVVVNDGVNQVKEYIGYVATKEWANNPIRVSTNMRSLGINAPDKGYYKFDLNFGTESTDKPYTVNYPYSDFFDFTNMGLIDLSEIKSIQYSVSYMGEILNTFEVDPELLKMNPIIVPGEVNFTCPVANNYSEYDFEFNVEIELTSGEKLKMTPDRR